MNSVLGSQPEKAYDTADNASGGEGHSACKSSTGDTVGVATSPAPLTAQRVVEVTHVVQSTEEADAFVKRLRQLQDENHSLTKSITKICGENAKLVGTVAQMQERFETLSKDALAETPMLQAIFAQDKFKLFGSSKSATRENLEKLVESIQKEYTAYCISHTSSNEDVQGLLQEVQSAHANIQKLSCIVREQQEVISCGPLAVTLSVAQDGASDQALKDLHRELERRKIAEEELREQIQNLTDELKEKSEEISRQQWELQAMREKDETADEEKVQSHGAKNNSSLSSPPLIESLRDENRRLNEKIEQLESELNHIRPNTAEQNRGISMSAKNVSCEPELPLIQPCTNCRKLQQQCSDFEEMINQTVPRVDFELLEEKNRALKQELEVLSKQLLAGAAGGCAEPAQPEAAGRGGMTDGGSAALEELSRIREDVVSLELRVSELTEENMRLTELSATLREDATRHVIAKDESEGRLAELRLECEAVMKDLDATRSERDGLNKERESLLQQLSEAHGRAKELTELEAGMEQLRQENAALQERVLYVKETEKALAEAREEVGLMERRAAARRDEESSMEARCNALTLTVQAVKEQLEESKSNVQRITEENEALRTEIESQKVLLKSREESSAMTMMESDTLRNESSRLMAENARLHQMNAALEGQVDELKRRVDEAVREAESRKVAACDAHGSSVQQEQRSGAAFAGQFKVESDGGASVPAATHNAVLEENKRLDECIQQMNVDIDRLTAELVVYRQNIDELEAENQEQVKHIDNIRSAHAAELASIAERFTAEATTYAESKEMMIKLQEECQTLKLEVSNQQLLLADKCAQEEKLLSTIMSTGSELEAVKGELRRVMFNVNEQLECVRQEKDTEMETRMADERRRHENECEKLCIQLHQIEEERLLLESELDKVRRAAEERSSDSRTGSTDCAADAEIANLRSQLEQLQASLEEAQSQLHEEQKRSCEASESFAQERTKMDSDAASMRSRIEQLEEKLQTARSEQLTSGAATLSIRRKKKKATKNKILSMAYLDDSPEVDVLAEASANTTCVNNNDETEKHLQEAHEMLSTLREENVQLKESLAQLTDKVQTLQQRETIMTSNVSKESEELRRRIHTLEKQLKEGGGAAPVHSGKGTGSSEEEMEKIKVLKAEVKRLNAKLKETREELRKRDMTGDVSVEQLKAELQLLANEVVPTKCKLAEYVAMADRIGIQYPFSDEMERCAVLRMKAMRPKSPPKKAHSNTTLRASTTEKNGKAANATPKKGTSSKKVKVRQAQEDAADAEDLR